MKRHSTLLIVLSSLFLLIAMPSCKRRGSTDRQLQLLNTLDTLKQHDDAILLVTFGSTWEQPHQIFEQLKQDFAQDFPDRDVFIAFTSEICIKRSEEKGLGLFYDPKSWLAALEYHGYRSVGVQSLHVIAGKEYQDLADDVALFQSEDPGMKSYIAGPLLAKQSDLQATAHCLWRTYAQDLADGATLLLMGHGKPKQYGSKGNESYTDLEQYLQQKVSPRCFVATVDMENNLIEDAIERMQRQGVASGRVICVPLMAIAGDHANNDMLGGNGETPEEGSWRAILTEQGYTCSVADCKLVGLAENPMIVAIWKQQLRQVLSKEHPQKPQS